MYILSREQIISSGIADMSVAQPIIEHIFRQKAAGTTAGAQEIAMIPDQPEAGAYYSLPAYLREEHVAGIKWSSHVPPAAAGQVYTHPVILLNELETGVPKALIEGQLISGLRTAAVSATAVKYLADPAADSLLICGTGFQARQQLLGVLPYLHHLKEVHVWSRTFSHAELFIEEMSSRFEGRLLVWRVHRELPESLDFARIVIAATSAAEPYLSPSHFVKGQLYLHIGRGDIAAAAVNGFDTIVCDDYQGGILTSSQSLFRLARQQPTIGEKVVLLEELILERSIIRQQEGKKLMFNAFGLSIFDLALANAALNHLLADGQTELPVFPMFKETCP
ncbi:hypothetical protein [Paenibacillus donghaensis]|uniref:Ornithine cyclodeaminase n=1 Tax=Paenibacillus donghaensis TaxID=414771 RepID=A0A2Z2K579_9BACL|nr:hypothetical protein [Paenibacillus donghaensis]ASA21206.1 hypothetical protein B9T62_10660 [Paenibacillus donghaensis]